MRASRLVATLLALQDRGRVTASALAEEFEVSVRTVYRDMDELSGAGIPVYADRGPGGGFALLEGFKAQLTGLTDAEVEAVLLAGFPQALGALGIAQAGATGRTKLLASRSGDRLVGRIADRVHLDPDAWYRSSTSPPQLQGVAAAVLSDRMLLIRYKSWSSRFDATVSPLGIVLKAGEWYLVADAGRGPRTFRIGSVEQAEVLEREAARPEGFDLASYWSRSVSGLERRLHRLTAVVRVSPGGTKHLPMLGSIAQRTIEQASRDESGWREAEIPIESIEHATPILLAFGAELEVVAPLELRIAMKRLATEVARLHD